MTYQAAAALPYNDRVRVVADLRGQLRLMALADGATPDWSTMTVEGPVEVTGLHGAPGTSGRPRSRPDATNPDSPDVTSGVALVGF